MDIISILTTIILTTTIATVITGVIAYAAFKVRDKRKPKAKALEASTLGSAHLEAIFLKPFHYQNADATEQVAVTQKH